jgi:hypothetical protein
MEKWQYQRYGFFVNNNRVLLRHSGVETAGEDSENRGKLRMDALFDPF